MRSGHWLPVVPVSVLLGENIRRFLDFVLPLVGAAVAFTGVLVNLLISL